MKYTVVGVALSNICILYSEAERQMEMHMRLFLICFSPQVDSLSTSGCVVRGSAVNSIKAVSSA